MGLSHFPTTLQSLSNTEMLKFNHFLGPTSLWSIPCRVKLRLNNSVSPSWWLSGKESICLCRRHRFNPWSKKIPQAREQLSLCAMTIKPTLYSLGGTNTKPADSNYWSTHALQREGCVPRDSSPHSPQPEESPLRTEDPAQPKIKIN